MPIWPSGNLRSRALNSSADQEPSMLEYTLSMMSLTALKSERRRVRSTSLWAGTAVGVRRSSVVGLPTFLAWVPLVALPLAEGPAGLPFAEVDMNRKKKPERQKVKGLARHRRSGWANKFTR